MKASVKKKYSSILPKYKLWLTSNDGKSFIGDGKWKLLKTIDEKGSLQAASDELGISYRHAWGNLKDTEDFLGIPLVEKYRGGKEKGKTILTEEGKRLIKLYEEFHLAIEHDIKKEFQNFVKKLKV